MQGGFRTKTAMTDLVLLLLLQALPAERTFEETVQAFARGEDGERAALLREGVGAIRPLAKVREASPSRIDALVYEIKASCAEDQARRAVGWLEEDRTCSFQDADFWVAFESLAPELGLLADPRLRGVPVTARVTLRFQDRPGREILDSLCRQTGLDYGFFYGLVVVARPARLWPAGPRSRIQTLSQGQAESVQALIEKLSSDGLEERIEAQDELQHRGPEVLPILERNLARPEPELVGRCREVMERLRCQGTGGVFHEPAVGRQILGGDDLLLAQKLRSTRTSIQVKDLFFEDLIWRFMAVLKIPFERSPAAQAHAGRVALEETNLDCWTALALVCHSEGFEFMIEEGALHIDTREAIDERVGTGD
jgi:hypothetical protein